MAMLRDLWLRLQDFGILDALPPALREPPGLWLTLSILVILLLWVARAAHRVALGGGATGESRRLEKEAKDLLRQGDAKEAGRAFEALGKTRHALNIYRRGDCHEDRALLLLRLGRRKEAKAVARDGGEWQLYGELCQEDGDLEESAVAFERAGQAYLAAQCYAECGHSIDAARCYLAAGMEAEVVRRLADSTGAEAADLLDQAVRASVRQMGGSGLSLELQEAVQRGVQLWLSQNKPERAFRLAVDSDRLNLAVPVARDYLEPSVSAAEICARAGAHQVAADLYQKLGDSHLEALQRAEHALHREARTEAAEWFEKAEAWAEAADQWAAAGNTDRAAELFARAGDMMSAAQISGPAHDAARGAITDPAQPWLTRGHVDGLKTELASAFPSALVVDPDPATMPSFAHVAEADATVPAGAATAPAGAAAAPASAAAAPAGAATRAVADPAPLVDADALSDSESRYQIVRELGRGGMGVVYIAEDRVLQRQVAYKVVPENALGVEVEPDSILAEARAAARLSHPNIVQVYDAGRRGKGFYVVMELIHGQSLEQILADRQITVAGALRIGLQVCAALDHAHKRHIIHRDLKPSNLMWSDERMVKLADFGLARAFEAGQGRVQTQPAGTPSYMAPEQIRGEPVSPLVDVYSFGCVMFELLCRESVFGTGPPSFHHHLTSTPRDPRQLRADLPEEPAKLILRCLAKDPSGRPQSAAALGRALATILKEL